MFKNLKSLFVEEDPSAKGKQKENPKSVAKGGKEVKKEAAKKTAATNTNSPAASKTIVTGTADPKFTEKLLKIIEANNQPGFDYLEFKQTLKGMSKMNLDEKTQFMSAYAAAQSMGVTPAKLVSSAQQYLNVLAQEETKFLQTVEAQTEKNVVGRKNQLTQMEAMVKQKEEQIKQLQAEIEADKKKMEESRNSLTDVAAKIESTKVSFLASYNGLKNQLLTDVEKINQYLK